MDYSAIILKLYRAEASLNDKHQVGDAETEFIINYEFLNQLVQFLDVALFCNTSETLQNVGNLKLFEFDL